MYLTRFSIRNIRSIEQFQFSLKPTERVGWHVLLGDNGSGKSTVARSLALALVGRDDALALRLNFNEWLRSGAAQGEVVLDLTRDAAFDPVKGGGKPLRGGIVAGLRLNRLADRSVELRSIDFESSRTPNRRVHKERYLLGNISGWFSAAYGPYRRFAGGNPEHKKFFYSHPRIGRHLSVFGEDVALSESLEWLAELETRKLREKPRRSLLDDVLAFVNQTGALPHGAQVVDVVNREVLVRDGNGARVSIMQLSDGYRSVLSMTLELLRQLTVCYGEDLVFAKIRAGGSTVELPGVVIVDEIDAHLHPPWQRSIGLWLTKVFPRMQFIVTTHSPLVCQAASRGSVWQLPTPGEARPGRRIEGVELERLLHGTVLEQLDSGLFGANIGRSDDARTRIARLAELHQKVLKGKLSDDERGELDRLRATLPTSVGVLRPTGSR